MNSVDEQRGQSAESTPTILVVSSSPLGHVAALESDGDPEGDLELEAIFRGVSKVRVHVQVERLNPPTLTRFQMRLHAGSVNVVHLACEYRGHEVILESPDGGESRVSAAVFTEALARSGVTLLVLSRLGNEGVSEALATKVPGVIRRTHLATAGISTIDGIGLLYATLAQGRTLGEAAGMTGGSFVAEGRTPEKLPTLSEGRATLSRGEPVDNLPGRTVDPFFGREDELRKAYAALQAGSRSPFLGVTGLPGAGKSAFARAVARRYGHLFMDGIAYLYLTSSIKHESVLPTALAHLMPGIISQPEATAENVVIDRLSKGQYLLILDDAERLSDEDAERLQSILSRWRTETGGRALLVMRERRRQFIPLIGANWIHIGSLSDAASVQLFSRALGGRTEAQRMVGNALTSIPRVCHHHPLLLRIASGSLSLGMRWGDLLRSIAIDLPGLNENQQVSAFLQVLDESLHRAELKVPSVGPLLDSWTIFGDFAPDDAWRFVSGDAEGASLGTGLTELARCNVISGTSIKGRDYWERPPIVTERLKTRWNKLSSATRDGYENLALDYFAHRLPPLSDAFFAHDWESLCQLLESGVKRGEYGRVLNVCDAAFDKRGNQILSTGPWETARRMAELGVRAAKGLGRVNDQVRHLVNLGECKYRAAKYSDGAIAYQEALSLLPDAAMVRDQRVDLRRRMGQVLYRVGLMDQAEMMYNDALADARLTGKPELVAAVEHQLGKVLYRRNRLAEAQELFERVRDTRAGCGDIRGLAKTLHELGRVHHAEQRFNAALVNYEDSLRRRREVDDRVGEQATVYQLALLALDFDDPERAEELLETCQKLADDLRDPFWVAHSMFLEARILRYRGHVTQALDKARQSEALSRKHEMGMAAEVERWIRDVRVEDKRRKALAYAGDRSRFTVGEATSTLRSDHGTRTLRREPGGWTCNCEFFAEYRTCSHSMALEFLLGDADEHRPDPSW